jgi:hypothetical protein
MTDFTEQKPLTDLGYQLCTCPACGGHYVMIITASCCPHCNPPAVARAPVVVRTPAKEAPWLRRALRQR